MIFYFTATGNGLDISNRLAQSLDDEIRNMVDEMKTDCSYEIEEGEKVGIVSPTYFYGLPLIVEEFIRKMRFSNIPYLYMVLSFGTTPGQAMIRAEKLFSECGYKLNGKLTVTMPENYILMFDPPTEAEAKRILSSAYQRVESFATAIKGSEDVDMSVPPTFFQKITGVFARPMYTHGRGTGRFYVDRTCTGCGRCVKVCPSKAIELIDRIPTWTKSKCLRCTACINRCPFKALQFGRSTRKRGRYVNPNVKFEE